MFDQDQQDTEFTGPHREMVRYLERYGFMLMIEVPFPPYVVDIYLSDIHAAVEVDGPYHTMRGDTKRDIILDETYFLPVFHVKADVVKHPEKWRDSLTEFFSDWASSYEQRWSKCEDRTPWL